MLLASCFFFLVFLLLALAACNDFLALAAGNSSSDALPLLQAGSADKGNHPNIADLFRLGNYYNLPRLIQKKCMTGLFFSWVMIGPGSFINGHEISQ